VAHMLSVMTPVNFCLAGAAARASIARRLRSEASSDGASGAAAREAALRLYRPAPAACNIPIPRFYSPGVMRWAVVVPAFMIHTPPDLLSSGNPSDCLVAPGTAIVMCVRVCSASGPIR
jgi:hypothetical protein